MVMKMSNSKGTISENSSSILLYLKRPDLLKLEVTSPMKTIIIQKGDYITQKVGTNPAITTKVTQTNDIARSFFAYNTPSIDKTPKILSQDTFSEGNNTLYSFVIDIKNQAPTGINLPQNQNFDKQKIVFNSSGMIVRQIMYGDDKELFRTENKYIIKEGIYILKSMTTIMETNGMTITSIITYDKVNVNTPISDKEFQLK